MPQQPSSIPPPADGPSRRPVLVLGSSSPARATLLRSAGIRPVVRHSAVDEDVLTAGFGAQAEDPHWLTQQLARAKALDVAAQLHEEGLASRDPRRRVVVVGADSMLEMDRRVLGKARSAEQVRQRWARMAGRTGVLVTGHTLVDLGSGRTVEATCATVVRFGRPDPEELEAYIATGEPLAVAGSCTIDGLGGAFIDGLDGDHTNVIGLSLPTLRRLLADLGIRFTDLWEDSSPAAPDHPGDHPEGAPRTDPRLP